MKKAQIENHLDEIPALVAESKEISKIKKFLIKTIWSVLRPLLLKLILDLFGMEHEQTVKELQGRKGSKTIKPLTN